MLHWEVLRTSSFSVLRTSVGNISWHYIENHLGTSSGRPRDVILSSGLVSTEKITRSVLPWLLYQNKKKKRVSTQMKKVIYSLSLSTQCYACCLKLVCGDWVRNSTVLSKLLETSHEITKSVNFSPKRDSHEEEYYQNEDHDTNKSSTLRLFSETRLTGSLLTSIYEN